MNITDAHLEQARELGREAGRAAGSWAAGGNTSAEHARKVLAMLADGDPASESHLPAYPDLSGEWADAPTPRSLVADIMGEGFEEPDDRLVTVESELCSAWEEGVSETFEGTCVAELRTHVPDGQES